MNDVQSMKSSVFEELELILRTTANLVRRIQPNEWSYTPHEKMRSLHELVRHLVLVPSQDLRILQEQTEEQVIALAQEIEDLKEANELVAIMEQGVKDLKEYMFSLSDTDFIYKETRPFYSEHFSTQAKWLIEITTHAMHHRSQLFTYLKLLGHDINMFDLY